RRRSSSDHEAWFDLYCTVSCLSGCCHAVAVVLPHSGDRRALRSLSWHQPAHHQWHRDADGDWAAVGRVEHRLKGDRQDGAIARGIQEECALAEATRLARPSAPL